MRDPRPRLTWLIAVGTAIACGPSGDGSTTETGATTDATTGDPGGTTEGTAPTTGDSTGEPGTGGVPADGCNMPDPSTWADFTLDLGDVPGADEFEVDLELACEVVAVDAAGSMIATDLSCLDGEGLAHAVKFDVATTDVGDPAWAAAEPVTLRVRGAQDFGGLLEATGAGALIVVEIALHRDADGMLLASATDSYGASADLYTPLKITPDRDACGMDLAQDDPGWPGPARDMALGFCLGDVERTLFTGQRDQLAAGAEVLAIDVAEATAEQCCHAETWIVAITRLVTPG